MAPLIYAQTNIFLTVHICQGVYNRVVPRTPSNPDLTPLFAALADRTRLRLLNLMNGREVCVCYFVEILRQSQPKISRHLAYLRRAGIVSARREGKWMHYRIDRPAHPGALAILEAALGSFSADREMQSDLNRLTRACCQPRPFVTIAGAPMPAPVPANTV
jgi:ArsR family transcriptional regulator, arsenate/arsenite/antimonite-responsive transcriptional repressor